ncbi:recombinase family protein [Streptomyces sp. NPDC007063]|uniref:recombinase family protein n=1 Tax=Streptomyces sp. NPDC007063 TaxID=3364772 RepID=UPI0036A17C5A
MTRLRGLRGIRLSVLTDETTSPERQRAATTYAADLEGVDLADREAVDLGVSASKVHPFERPELSRWIASPDEWDAMVWWRFDRLIRSMADMHDVAKWCADHKKVLIFAEGPSGKLVLDFRNPLDPITSLLLMVFAFAAQMEAQSIQERVTSAQSALRHMPLRWRGGGRPPYGYRPEEIEGAPGWTLVPDPHAADVVREMIRQLRRGKSPTAIAAALTASGELSPRDYWAASKGRGTGGKAGKGERERFAWSAYTVTSVLSSVSLLGWKVHNGAPVRDDLGEPVPLTDGPLLTRAEYDEVQVLLGQRERSNGPRSDTNALLMGVLLCAGCGGRMYLSKLGKRPPTYKCGFRSRGQTCASPSAVKQEWADKYARDTFLGYVGDVELITTRVVPGYDPAPELDATRQEYEDHMAQQGAQRSTTGRAAWQRRADALDARMADLESREAVPSRTEHVGQGETYRDRWERSDTTERRRMMRAAEFTVTCARGSSGGWRRLDESRMDWDLRNEVIAAAADERHAIRREADWD